MRKAVLVMDMPDNCFKCKLQDWANCRITKKCHTRDSRPDWCPLRELPEKAEVSDCDELCDTDDWYDSGYTDGYNACIDELLKGEEG